MLLYNMQILLNVMGCFTNITEVFKVQGAFYEITTLLTTPSGQVDYYERKPITDQMKQTREGNLAFQGVDFFYPTKTDVQVLNNVNIQVGTNQIVALVGHSGSGKSSIISLIERFYDPVKGRILFNGMNL